MRRDTYLIILTYILRSKRSHQKPELVLLGLGKIKIFRCLCHNFCNYDSKVKSICFALYNFWSNMSLGWLSRIPRMQYCRCSPFHRKSIQTYVMIWNGQGRSLRYFAHTRNTLLLTPTLTRKAFILSHCKNNR